jgi:hypothetical protein
VIELIAKVGRRVRLVPALLWQATRPRRIISSDIFAFCLVGACDPARVAPKAFLELPVGAHSSSRDRWPKQSVIQSVAALDHDTAAFNADVILLR